MWIEIGNELFNFSRIVSVCCIGDFDIAFYDKVDECDEYMVIAFESNEKREECYKFIKYALKAVEYG